MFTEGAEVVCIEGALNWKVLRKMIAVAIASPILYNPLPPPLILNTPQCGISKYIGNI